MKAPVRDAGRHNEDEFSWKMKVGRNTAVLHPPSSFRLDNTSEKNEDHT